MAKQTVCADFYEVVSPRWEAQACRLVAELYAQGRRAYLRVGSESRAHRLGELLWTFQDESFIPHGIWQGEADSDEPVAVGWLDGNPNGAGTLVLVCESVPEGLVVLAERFSRVIDFVPKRDADATQAARRRYLLLKEAGIELHYHKVKG